MKWMICMLKLKHSTCEGNIIFRQGSMVVLLSPGKRIQENMCTQRKGKKGEEKKMRKRERYKKQGGKEKKKWEKGNKRLN